MPLDITIDRTLDLETAIVTTVVVNGQQILETYAFPQIMSDLEIRAHVEQDLKAKGWTII